MRFPPAALLAIALLLRTASSGCAQAGDFWEQITRMREEITRGVRDKLDDLREGQAEPVITSEYRERSDRYVLQLFLHGHTVETVHVRLEGTRLTFTTPEAPGVAAYEQQLTLPAAGDPSGLRIHRGQGRLVVVVPKAGHTLPPGAENAAAGPSAKQVQEQMNRIFEEFFSEEASPSTVPEPSIRTEETGGTVIFRTTLPDPSVPDIDVTIENQTLRVRAGGPAGLDRSIPIPGRVRAAEMTVERRNGELVVTIPKA